MKISVVITFYNNSKYINNCINNIHNIEDDRIEIIIMDDGSDESEFSIIKKSLSSIKNKKIILDRNSTNMGAGYTKNRAVSIASGEYIIFLDCDDYVDNDYYIKILDAILKTNADIICTDIVTDVDGEIVDESLLETNIIREKVKCLYKGVYEISGMKLLGNKYSASACNKAIKKSFLVKFPFYDNKCDDLTAVIPSICTAETILYVEGVHYYYCQTHNSITRQKCKKNKTRGLIDSIDSLFRSFDILKFEDVIESNIEVFYANNVIPFIYFSILNNDFRNCVISLKYLKKKINKYNYANYLVVKNPYLCRLLYLDIYSINLLKKIQKNSFIEIVIVLFCDRIRYRVKRLFRRI